MIILPVRGRSKAQSGTALITILVLVTLGCGPREPRQARTPVRIAVPGNSFLYLPIYLAAALGYFREQGLDAVIEDVRGGSKSLQALLGGSVDVAGISIELGMQVAAEGHHVQTFLTLVDGPGYVLAVSPATKHRIGSVEDLKGAVIGVSSPGSGSHNFANYILVRHGLSLRQVSITGIGLAGPAVAAFQQGQIDAAVLTGNAATTIERRFPKLLILADTRTAEGVKQVFGTDVYPAQGVSASTEWLRNNPETARKLVRALMQAMRYMREHSPEEIRNRMPGQYRAPDAASDLEAIRQTVPMLSRNGMVTPDGAEAVRRVLTVSSDKVRNAKLDVSQTYTNEFVPSTSPQQTH